MGMYFNTARTKEIVSLANTVFDETGFPKLVADKANIINLINALGAGPGNLYALAQYLNIDFGDVPTKGTKTLKHRWKSWCDYWDANPAKSGGNAAVALGKAIKKALQAQYKAVEFFAVPGDGTNLDVTTYDSSPDGGTPVLVVTITTKTYDQIDPAG